MSVKGYVGELVDVAYDTEGTQSGLTDVVATIFVQGNISGTPDFTITLNEIGSTGVYRNTFTPTVSGTHIVIVNSLTSNPSIADKAGAYVIEDNSNKDVFDRIVLAETNINANTDAELAIIKGPGFLSGTDSLEALSNAIAGVASAVGAPTSRGRVL